MADDSEQCRALTGDGERCSRPARENGFCHQHDESDPTVDDSSTEAGSSDEDDATDSSTDEDHEGTDSMSEDTDENDESGENGENESGSESRSGSESESEAESESESESETEDDGEESQSQSESEPESEDRSGSDGSVGLIEIRDAVRGNATDLIGHPLDAVVAIAADGDEGWRAVVEVVERSSVPDTEDILGRYEVFLDDDGNFQSYGRLDRYRRSDTDVEAV